MKHKILSLLGVAFCSVAICHAQKLDTSKSRSDMDSFVRSITEDFNNFRRESMAQFAEFVKNPWKEFEETKPVPKPAPKPIPPIIRDEDDKEKPIKTKPVIIEEVVEPVIDEPQPQPVEPIEEVPVVEPSYLNFTFFGTSDKVRLDKSTLPMLRGIDESSVASMLKGLSTGEYDNLVIDCLGIRKNRNLSDWAYLQMLKAIATEAYPNRGNEAEVLMGYLYLQSGYRMRLASDGTKLYMLFASKHLIFERSSYAVDGERYYGLNDLPSRLFICQVAFPKESSLSLLINTNQLFSYEKSDGRSITFEGNSDAKVDVAVNKNLLDFYSTYPTSALDGNMMTRWAMYAQTPMDPNAQEQLYSQLIPLIAGKNELEAANLLLNFVQTGFTYKYDEEIWGEDRAFFAEESLIYPYCDCEDRSILFSHIVRDLLELDVALVYTPGHLFTAVKFSEDVDGSYFSIGNDKYVICEPTCTNGAPVGWCSIEDGTNNELIILSKINYGKSFKTSSAKTMYKKSLFPVCVNGKYGYKDKEDKIVVPCVYDSVVDNKLGDKFLYAAIKSNKMTLFDYGGTEHLRNAEGYIPLELNPTETTPIGDYFAIVKFDGEWYLVFLVWGPLEADFCFREYDMNNVSYENNIYCKPQGKELEITDKFIILKKKANNKYGVLNLKTGCTVVPFEYDNISFAENDKSKVRVYSPNSKEYKVVSLE